MSEREVSVNVLKRAKSIYRDKIDAVHRLRRHKQEVPPFPDGSAVGYIELRTVRMYAEWLDSKEEESINKKLAGPRTTSHGQVRYCLSHIKGAAGRDDSDIFDNSVFYGIRDSKRKIAAYVQTLTLEKSERKAMSDTFPNLLGPHVTVRDLTLFRDADRPVSDEYMTKAVSDALTVDALRFSNSNDGHDLVFTLTFESGDEREFVGVLDALGFKRQEDLFSTDLVKPKPTGFDTETVDADTILYVLSAKDHLINVGVLEGVA
ncbi:hypothetical protein A2Z00_02715 [Candidatus Gottesmanbacteria bacterium RBG_13_45_10]|uniref:Uncharacterized protein n=1 Tax=Candidatus Gottesmanbacteria bacterium RBG_13_45_10 TaxID=1798370 RepID=A0A1F5ZG95_9BACT|nr:MAG: hypothetical protein A2Z00_02715 [Candidatus Gottesmanbacteria bacterium RBG_13_45_10]